MAVLAQINFRLVPRSGLQGQLSKQDETRKQGASRASGRTVVDP